MASSTADWVFGEARLISSASTMCAKMGPARNWNCRPSWLSVRICAPMMSEGMRSGVNWIRLNDRPSAVFTERTSRVLPRPGTPSRSTCPPAKNAANTLRSTARWPTITRWTCRSMASNRSRNAAMRCMSALAAPADSLIRSQPPLWRPVLERLSILEGHRLIRGHIPWGASRRQRCIAVRRQWGGVARLGYDLRAGKLSRLVGHAHAYVLAADYPVVGTFTGLVEAIGRLGVALRRRALARALGPSPGTSLVCAAGLVLLVLLVLLLRRVLSLLRLRGALISTGLFVAARLVGVFAGLVRGAVAPGFLPLLGTTLGTLDPTP